MKNTPWGNVTTRFPGYDDILEIDIKNVQPSIPWQVNFYFTLACRPFKVKLKKKLN